MSRLSWLVLALGLLASPPAADAQQPRTVFRLGILSPTNPPAPADQTSAANLISTVLRHLGYVEGQNLVIERRFAEGKLDRLPGRARELVQLRVDVIIAFGPAAVQAAKEATGTIPIVIFAAADPIGQGWVASLARPGRNITGVVITADTQLADKRLELIKEMVPRATRIAMLATAEPHVRDQVREAQKAAASLGVKLVVVEVRDGDYERAFASIVVDRAHALVSSWPRSTGCPRSTSGGTTWRTAG